MISDLLFARAIFRWKNQVGAGKPLVTTFAKTLQKKDNVKTIHMPP
jgi:hypothetical protein